MLAPVKILLPPSNDQCQGLLAALVGSPVAEIADGSCFQDPGFRIPEELPSFNGNRPHAKGSLLFLWLAGPGQL